jgi:hypothetical protein
LSKSVEYPTLFTLSGIATLLSERQPQKAAHPIPVTPAGIVTFVKDPQLRKA